MFQLFLESPWNVQNVLFFLKIRICYITCTKIMLWFFSSSQFFFHSFFCFLFFYFLFCSFFKVIKIDQSFCEEDFHLWLINSWGHEQESPTTWVLSFFLKKKKYIHAHTHKHTRSHMFLLLSMFKSWCLVMVWSTVLFQLDPVGLILCPQHHPAGSWRTHTTQCWYTEPAQIHRLDLFRPQWSFCFLHMHSKHVITSFPEFVKS